MIYLTRDYFILRPRISSDSINCTGSFIFHRFFFFFLPETCFNDRQLLWQREWDDHGCQLEQK